MHRIATEILKIVHISSTHSNWNDNPAFLCVHSFPGKYNGSEHIANCRLHFFKPFGLQPINFLNISFSFLPSRLFPYTLVNGKKVFTEKNVRLWLNIPINVLSELPWSFGSSEIKLSHYIFLIFYMISKMEYLPPSFEIRYQSIRNFRYSKTLHLSIIDFFITGAKNSRAINLLFAKTICKDDRPTCRSTPF